MHVRFHQANCGVPRGFPVQTGCWRNIRGGGTVTFCQGVLDGQTLSLTSERT